MDVKIEAVYIFALEKGCGISQFRWVIGAQNLFHARHFGCMKGTCLGMELKQMGLEGRVTKPHERLAEVLSDELAAVNELIHDRMKSEHAPRIPQVTAHLVDAGGKRIRPMLTLATARLCGYEGRSHVLLASAVEFIHTATLLHDDVVDKSGQRRGRPTANLLWDNKSSVLVGDYLFARAFQMMVETGSIRVLDILANASATIAEGEVLQLSMAENVQMTEEIYLKIIRGKTAALFSAATEVSGVIAECDDAAIRALFEYGDALGISFQMVDDLLDYTGDISAIGKNTGDDFRDRKLTLPVIKAYAAGDANERDFWRRAFERGQQAEGDFEKAMEILQRRGTLEETRAEALAWAERSKAALALFEESELRDLLFDLSDYVVARIS